MSSHEQIVEGDKVIEMESGRKVQEKSYQHVVAGLVAATKNPHVSEEGKQHAQEQIEALEAAHAESIGQPHAKKSGDQHHHLHHPQQQHEHQQHHAHSEAEIHEVNRIRGMKAALHNPNVSESKKEELQGKLEEYEQTH